MNMGYPIFFVSFSKSIFSFFSFQIIGLSPPWLSLRYFILFNVIINGTVSFISLSDSSLLAYRATDFYIILYPETLLIHLLDLITFSGDFRVFYINYHVICNSVLLLQFQFGCLLFIFLL